MTAWRIVAVGPAQALADCAWRDAASGAQAIAAGHDMGFDLILIGQDSQALDLAAWPNIQRVAVARCEGFKDIPSHHAAIAASILADSLIAACVILPAGAFGDEVAVALADAIDARLLGQLNDVRLEAAGLEVTRAAFGGRVELTLRFPAGQCVATMRRAQAVSSGAQAVREVIPQVVIVAPDLPPEIPCERVALPDRKAALEGAGLVVCGGRGLDAGGFENLEDIADALGGVVAGSLPAVDAGMAPVSHQVGQSGKFVTPKLYLGVGVSGTLQHLAGIGTATSIVAINSDPEAALFHYAELGVVADAREFLPMLIAELHA